MWHEVEEAQLFNMEKAEALAAPAVPTANAVEVPAQDATPNELQRKTKKRSRVHEVYETDPADTTYSLCQCLTSAAGRVCNARISHQYHQERTAMASAPLGRTSRISIHPSTPAWCRTIRATLR